MADMWLCMHIILKMGTRTIEVARWRKNNEFDIGARSFGEMFFAIKNSQTVLGHGQPGHEKTWNLAFHWTNPRN